MKYANWDILQSVATKIKPKSYLEIGVLSGESLKVVLSHCTPKRVVLCDNWSYKGSPYRNSDHVTEILRQFDQTSVKYLNGDSHVLIKTLDEKFDLIHIDGDHSFEGALADLRDSWPLLNTLGYLVLDDLIHAPPVEKALDVFEKEISDSGFAIRLKTKPDGVAVLRKG